MELPPPCAVGPAYPKFITPTAHQLTAKGLPTHEDSVPSELPWLQRPWPPELTIPIGSMGRTVYLPAFTIKKSSKCQCIGKHLYIQYMDAMGLMPAISLHALIKLSPLTFLRTSVSKVLALVEAAAYLKHESKWNFRGCITHISPYHPSQNKYLQPQICFKWPSESTAPLGGVW